MKLFSWVQNKFIGRHESDKINISPSNKNETSPELGATKSDSIEWPHGFLSIGTLWIKDYLHDNPKEMHKDLTSEETGEIHKELNEFSSNESGNSDQEAIHDQHFSSIVPNNKAKDVYLENSANGNDSALGKKSLSFLLKKMFICGSAGLGPVPSSKDPILNPPPMTKMEKILRAILEKKIHPQSPSQSMTRKKYLKSANIASTDVEEESDDENEGSKWVKTDTEYIVLEI